MAAVSNPTAWSATGFELTVVGAGPLRATVRASGALDLAARESIVDVLGHQRDSGRVFVRLDLTDVTFMDCSCLRTLVEEHRLFVAARGLLVLAGVGPRIGRLLELTGLDQILLAAESVPDLTDIKLEAPVVPRRRDGRELDRFIPC